MRFVLASLTIVTFAVEAEAAPVPSKTGARPIDRDALQAEARLYGQQLVGLANQVAEQYVRPVNRADLIQAAVVGLYEAARLPTPADLAGRVTNAKTDEELTDLLRQLREEVGVPEALGDRGALAVSCQAMVRSLDPHSGVVTPQEQRRNGGMEREQVGVGLDLDDARFVRSVVPGGPAQRAGLRPGDEIVEVEGESLKDRSSAAVLAELDRGKNPPTPTSDGAAPDVAGAVEITYRRKGADKTTTVKVERQRFKAECVLGVRRDEANRWDYLAATESRVAHVRVPYLARGAVDELRDVVEQLRGQEKGLSGLVLDLRWCPGGFVDEAVGCARLFLKEGEIATVKARAQRDVTYQAAPDDKGITDLPLVVLVNGDTSGGAELLAAALQDHGRARIVGQRTLGKASVQTPIYLGVAQIGIKLTSGTFHRPNGKNLHRHPDSKSADDWGVRPDDGLDCRLSPELNKSLKESWGLQTLRPGASTERLPLDDPTADPPRQMAVEALVREIKAKAQARAEHR